MKKKSGKVENLVGFNIPLVSWQENHVKNKLKSFVWGVAVRKCFCNAVTLERREPCCYYYTNYSKTFVPANFKHVSQYYSEEQFWLGFVIINSRKTQVSFTVIPLTLSVLIPLWTQVHLGRWRYSNVTRKWKVKALVSEHTVYMKGHKKSLSRTVLWTSNIGL
jgi:hypothetical protein